MSRFQSKNNYSRRLFVDQLEARLLLTVATVAGSEIANFQAVGSGLEEVAVIVATPQNSSTAGVPQATGLTSLRYDKGGADYRLSLLDAFSDSDGLVTDLVFSVSDSGDSIFNSLTIDQTTGEVVVDLVDGTIGSSQLTVLATDANGNSATTKLDLDVDQLDEVDDNGPVLLSFSMTIDPYGNLVFSGEVEVDSGTDTDDMTVEFGGDLEGNTTTVDSNGTFSFTTGESDMGNDGTVSAQVTDGSGNTSTELFVSWDD